MTFEKEIREKVLKQVVDYVEKSGYNVIDSTYTEKAIDLTIQEFRKRVLESIETFRLKWLFEFGGVMQEAEKKAFDDMIEELKDSFQK